MSLQRRELTKAIFLYTLPRDKFEINLAKLAKKNNNYELQAEFTDNEYIPPDLLMKVQYLLFIAGLALNSEGQL